MKKVFLVLFTVLFLPACVTAREANDDLQSAGEAAVADTKVIMGSVVVFGNDPFTYAGIVAEDGTHYAILPPEKEAELYPLQGRLVKFTVVFVTPQEPSLASLNLRGGAVTPLAWEIVL